MNLVTAWLIGILLLPTGADRRPSSRLLAWVPDDAQALLIVRGLRDSYASWKNSTLAAGIARLPALREWNETPDRRRLDEALEGLKQAVGFDLDTIRDDLLGEEVLFSLHPNRRGEPHQLILVQPRRTDLLREAVDRVNQAELASKRITSVEKRSVPSGDYYARLSSDPGSQGFFAFTGSTLAWSSSEEVLRRVLQRAGDGDTEQLPAWLETLDARMPESSLVRLYIDRSLWRPALRLLALARAPEGETPVQKRLRTRALEFARTVRFFGLSIEIDPVLRVQAYQELDPAVESPWKPIVAPSAVLSRTPAFASDSMLLEAGATFDPTAWLLAARELGESADPRRTRLVIQLLEGLLQDSGSDTHGILARLGPAVRLELSPADPGGSSEPRLDIHLTLDHAATPELRERIGAAVQALLCLIALDPERDPEGLTLEASRTPSAQFWTLSGKPQSLFVRIDARQFVLSTRPLDLDSKASPTPRPPAPPAGAEPDLRAYLRIHAAPLRQWLGQHRNHWVRQAVRDREEDEQSAGKDFDQVVALLELIRSLELTQHADSTGTALRQSLRIEPAATLPSTSSGQPAASAR